MKETVTTAAKHIAKDRIVLLTFVILLLLCLVFAVYFALRVKPSDIQVYIHYTSYGGVNFYASQWYYALAYSLFFVFIGAVHSIIGAKLYTLRGRQFALYFGWFSVGVVLIGAVNFSHIVNVAFPL